MQATQAGGHCPLYFLTPVWGAAYIQVFIEVVLPSQLSPGNLPAIRDGGRSRYLVFTTKDDAEYLQASDAFRRVNEILPVDILLIEKPPIVPHDTMSDCYRRGIAAGQASGAALVFLTPDLVHADNNFASVRRWVNEGRDVVFVAGIRTEKQGVVRALKASFMTPDGAIVIPPRELVRIGLENLHVMGRASLFCEGNEDLIPANLYWRAGKEGLSARCFHLHPIVVRPQCRDVVFRGTVDDDYVAVAVPDLQNDYVVTNSDEFMMIELSDAGRSMPTNFKKGSIEHVAEWAEQFANQRHRRLFSVPIRIHAGVDKEGAWLRAEAEAAGAVEKIQNMLARSTLNLMMQMDPALWRRVIRRGLDAEIERAQLGGAASAFHSMRRYESLLIRSLYAAYSATATASMTVLRATQKAIFGTERKPRYFSWRRKTYVEINQAVTTALADIKGGGQLGGEPFDSVAPDLRDLTVRLSPQGGCLVARSTDVLVSEGSLPFIVVDRNLPSARDLPIFFNAIKEALEEDGRLVMVVNGSSFWSDSGPACMDANSVALHLLDAGFVISVQQRLGNREAALVARLWVFVERLALVLRRKLRFFPLYALFNVCVGMPVLLIAKPVVEGVVWCWCRFGKDVPQGSYVASVTVATKKPSEAAQRDAAEDHRDKYDERPRGSYGVTGLTRRPIGWLPGHDRSPIPDGGSPMRNSDAPPRKSHVLSSFRSGVRLNPKPPDPSGRQQNSATAQGGGDRRALSRSARRRAGVGGGREAVDPAAGAGPGLSQAAQRARAQRPGARHGVTNPVRSPSISLAARSAPSITAAAGASSSSIS